MNAIHLEQLISDNLNIPTLPEVVLRVNAMVTDTSVGLREIGEMVALDPPLTAKVLRIANSAYYGLQERCISAEHATAMLGPRVLRNIVMQASVIGHFDHLKNHPGFDIDRFWQHSILTAQACQLAATRRCKNQAGLSPDEFYVCGLLHDIGQVLMLEGLRESYIDAWGAAGCNEDKLDTIERENFGFDHTEVGALIADRWGLPKAVHDAIRFHHGSQEELATRPVAAMVANMDRAVQRVARDDPQAAREGLIAAAPILELDPSGVNAILDFLLNQGDVPED